MFIFKYDMCCRPTFIQDGGYLYKQDVGEVIGFANVMPTELGEATVLSIEDLFVIRDLYEACALLEEKGFTIRGVGDAYKYLRKKLYKNVGEQLDMLYHDQKDGTNNWVLHNDEVRETEPK